MFGDVEALALIIGRRTQADRQIDDLVQDGGADARPDQGGDRRGVLSGNGAVAKGQAGRREGERFSPRLS
jgi:hypothetical protein